MAGYHCLVYNAPGVGLTLYEKGLPTRPDCEHFVTPTVDFLLTRADVDPRRLCVAGESFAAYLVPRAAAFEPRFAAAVSWGALYSWGSPYRGRRLISSRSSAPRTRKNSSSCASATTSEESSAGSRVRSSI
jgi:hypothetical protein